MTITRWTPLRDLISVREAMDKLFDETLIPPAFMSMDNKAIPIDLVETGEAFLLKAQIPGVDPSRIVVEATPSTITIKGETEEKKEEKKVDYIRQELRYGRFERGVELPTEIDPAKVEAAHTHGMLTLKLPKSEVVKPKTVQVKVL